MEWSLALPLRLNVGSCALFPVFLVGGSKLVSLPVPYEAGVAHQISTFSASLSTS
jgi:hypothetical protein